MKYILFCALSVSFLTKCFSQTSGEIYTDFAANKSNSEKALGLAKNGFSAAKQEGNNQLAGIFSFEMAKIYQKSSDYSAAIEQSLVADVYFKKENDASKIKTNRLLLFDLYRKSSRDKEAISLGKDLISNASGSERCKLEVDVASIYFLADDYSQAISLLEKRTSNCQTSVEFKSLELLGSAYNNYGNYTKAREVFERGAKLASKEGNLGLENRFNELVSGVNNNSTVKQKSTTNYDLDKSKEKEKYIASVKKDSEQLFGELSKLDKDFQISKLKLLYVEQEFEQNKLLTAIEKQESESALKLKTAENKKQKATIDLAKANLQNKQLTILFLSAFIVMAVIVTLLLLRTNKRQKQLNKELIMKNSQITEQSVVIVAQNKKMDASIDYGRFIQNQLLPATTGFEKLFPTSFELQLPLDKLSGDFLWYKELKGIKYICLVDCTGHGIPGAILSIIANEVLEKAIQVPFNNLVELMNTIADSFYASFRSQGIDGQEEEVFEGMDLCLVAIDESRKQLKVASANNSAILVSDVSVQELRTSRASFNANNKSIKTEELMVDYNTGDYLYLYTDGYYDQKGGSKNQKFGKQQTLDLIRLQAGKDIQLQKQNFLSALRKWQGNQKQIDDVSIVGIKL